MVEHNQFSNLLDVVSRDFLQDLLNRFSEATEVRTLITDNLGKPLTWSNCNSNLFSDFCARMRANPETSCECEKCDAFGGISASHRRSPYIYRCHMDFVEVAVPIFINEHFSAVIMIGQLRVEEHEHNSLDKPILPIIDINSDQDLKALYERTKKELPLIPLKKLRSLANMLHSIANYISEISVNSLLKDANNQLNIQFLREQNYKNKLEKNLQKLELHNMEMRLKPQFLFNVLNTINNFVLLENPQRASEVISSLSDLMRYNLRHADQLSTVGEEFKSIQDYLNIKQISTDGRISINTSIDENCFDAIIPPFSIQHLVVNAFIHGLESKTDGGAIYIELSKLGNKIKIIVSDNGVGMPPVLISQLQALKKSELSNTSTNALFSIIKILNHYFNDEFNWNIQSFDNQGTTITIIIPYWPKEEGATHYG